MPNGNIKINGYYLKMENINVDTSFPYYNLNTTKIFNGTEINTQGEWNGISFSFETYLTLPYRERNKYDKILQEMMSKPCEVVCRDFGGLFYANVVVKKQPITGNPNGLSLNFSIKQLPITSDYYPDTKMTNLSRNRLKG